MKEGLQSQTTYKVKSKETILVPMRDGVRIAVDIYRPDAGGKFPALLAMSGYGKALQALPMIPQPHLGSLVWDGTLEAGDTKRIVDRGYVHIIADVRGCGDSEGEHVGMFDMNEPKDGYDLVEWIAQQPWCDGNVGMIGISYFACMQVFIAAEQPPHLKAIFPWEVFYDIYRQAATDEGVIHPLIYRLYSGRGMDPGQTHGSGYANRNCVSASIKNMPEDEYEQLWQERLDDPDLKTYSIYWSVLRYPAKSPFFADFLLHPNDGPFYWERTPHTRLDKIKVPVYVGGPWAGLQSGLWAKGGWHVYSKLNAPKKMIMGPGDERPWHETHEEALRWFDYWLKDIKNGIMDEPPIKIFTSGSNVWRTENEWPLARTDWTKYFLRARGRLMKEPPKFNEGPDCFVQQPISETSEVSSIKYLTEPFNEDLEVTGPMAIYLYASIDQDDTNWRVTLTDVDEYGLNRYVITEDWLKASHRAVDENKSGICNPWHPHTENEPLTPGKVYDYAIALAPRSHVFKAGHRIEIDIASMDNATGGLHICNSKTTLHKVHHDLEYASHLILPVIPKT